MDVRLELTHRALGAQLLQARRGDDALFYLSPLRPDGAQPVRGGVPVLFPQFADRGALPKHGFVRNLPWRLLDESTAGDTRRVTYAMDIAPGQCPDWPHAARLVLAAELAPDALMLRLRVTNTGDTAFAWTGGLHPYVAVDDLRRCELDGLQDLAVHDRYDPARRQESPAGPRFDGAPFERLYDACPPLRLRTGGRTLALSAMGFDQWMVWNPGEAGGQALADLPAGDWQRFVCVEPVCVSRPVRLGPGESFEGGMQLRVVAGAN